MNPDTVQHFLNQLEPMQSFAVLFRKSNGEQRAIVGNLDPNGKTQSESIAMQTEEGWKRFNVNSVIWIGYPDEIQQVLKLMKELVQ